MQLGAVVQAAADMLAYTLRSHGIVLELALAEPLPDAQADPDQLGQVVLNLTCRSMHSRRSWRQPMRQTPPSRRTS